MIKSILGFGKDRPILSFVIAFFIFIALLVMISMGEIIIKRTFSIFMYIPNAVGISEPVQVNEIYRLTGADEGLTISLPEAGLYAIYTSDIWMLNRQALLLSGDSNFLLEITDSTGELVDTANIHRGLRPYDVMKIPGRPIITLEIIEPGEYTFQTLTTVNESQFYLLPHRNVGREGIISLVLLLELIATLGPFTFIYTRRYLASRQEARLRSTANRKAWDQAFNKDK